MTVKEHTHPGLLNREYVIGNLVMLAAVFFWGISFISIKVALREIPPSTLALIRFAIASLILGVLCARLEPGTKIVKKDLPLMVLAGALGITLYFYFENLGVKLTTVVNAALIVTFVPLITICLDVIFFHSKVTFLKVLGAGIALMGTYLSVTANGQLSLNSANFKGNMLMVCAVFVWAFYTLINKFLQRRYSGLAMTTYQMIFGTALLVPLALLEAREWRMFSMTSFWHIMFLAVCCSVLGYLFYMYALKHLDVTVTTIYMNLVPVVGVAGGYLFLHESVLPVQLVGGLLTFLAIIVVNLEVVFRSRTQNKEGFSL